MEILVRGQIPEETSFIGICSRCSTKVRFKRKEGQYVSNQHDGEMCKVACPVCNGDIYGYREELSVQRG